MKNPGFQSKAVWLGWVALIALTGTILAQPPLSMRTKPQVIYHLPRSSNYAATLHSQAKGQNNDLPVDGGRPTSLSTSRANANAAAAEPQAPAEAATPRATAPSVKPPKLQSKRSFRSQAPPRPKERRNSHGNSHKK